MVSPLDVKIMESAKHIHDLVGTWSAVKHVTKYVKGVDGELLNQVAYGDNEIVGTTSGYDGLDDNVNIGLLVAVGGILVQQLLNDIREAGGQRFADFGARILRRNITAHTHKTVYGDKVPVVKILVVGDAAFY